MTFPRFAAFAAMLASAGCALFGDDPYVKVSVTPLNWVEIHYYNTNYTPVKRTSVRITGMGRVEVKTGSSRLISDPFSKDMKSADWDDINTCTVSADPEHVRDIFQQLVNAGLFDREKNFKGVDKPAPGRFMAVRAAMDGKTFSENVNIFQSDPDLAEALLAVVQEFRMARLGAGSRSRRNPPAKEKKK